MALSHGRFMMEIAAAGSRCPQGPFHRHANGMGQALAGVRFGSSYAFRAPSVVTVSYLLALTRAGRRNAKCMFLLVAMINFLFKIYHYQIMSRYATSRERVGKARMEKCAEFYKKKGMSRCEWSTMMNTVMS